MRGCQGESRDEQHTRIASDLYDARRTVRSLAGTSYPRLVAEWMRLLRMAMARESKPVLPACLSLTRHTDEPFHHLWLMAAAVELIEAGDTET